MQCLIKSVCACKTLEHTNTLAFAQMQLTIEQKLSRQWQCCCCAQAKNTKTYNKMQRAPFLPPTDRERTAEREKKWQQKYDECLEYIHNNRFIHTQTHTLSALTEWAKSQCNWKLNLMEQIKSYQPNTSHSTPSIFAVVVAALNVIAFLLYLIGFLSKNRCYFVCFKLEKIFR